jgi:serine/threonine protein kinase
LFPVFPGLTILKRLGSGGFGSVYLALDASQHEVAVKVLDSVEGTAAVRFAREARILAENINNRFVVDVFAAVVDEQPPYIVMEYCRYGSLRSWTRDIRPWTDVVGALVNVLQGLAGIHGAPGFHRDIKPDNLLWTMDHAGPVVKVADFGLARREHVDSEPMTRNVAGTGGYLAPELSKGAPFTAACDIYSLGVTTLELLTGAKRPEALANCPCPGELKALVARMISFEPSARPSLRDIAEEMESLADKSLWGRGKIDVDLQVDGSRVAESDLDQGVSEQVLGASTGDVLELGQPETDSKVDSHQGVPARQQDVRALVEAFQRAQPVPASSKPEPAPLKVNLTKPLIRTPGKQDGGGLGGLLVAAGGAALVAYLATAGRQGQGATWDAAVERYRGPDGTFRKR